MSSAAITAVVVLESPRNAPDSPKTIFFDGQIYQGAGQPLLAAFRYFNANNMVFDDVGFYFLHATVAKMAEGAVIPPSESDIVYDLVGDIVFLIPAPDVDPKYLPWVHIAGTYTSALRDAKKHGGSTLPVRCFVKDSPKYKQYSKPVPNVNSQVTFTGSLTSVDRNAENGTPEYFRLEVDSVTFMGKATVPAKPSPAPASNSQTPAKRKPKYNWSSESPTPAKRSKPDADNNNAASASSSQTSTN
ncbi:hypothetical protein FIBSPDRAFT_958295 [Athelia psychrophila]|uniref:Uncharacterized protein n=1 Tax=Athelia psychrophila TaxID=1759441 RepID=A0A166EUG3_9AGAM|nr:hypothetical protein FIBSPDRAFT_958295 [Fibularhizoctonia sp. CBS 109695]